jgi:NAD(P)-dependent dehydrogenase (short-subunit alcohol dehydrogenase family)
MVGGIEVRVCLLTGASGRLGTNFIGRHSSDYRIAAITHQVPVVEPEQVYTVQADLRDRHEVHAAVDGVLTEMGSVDLLINAAVLSRWGPATGPQVLDSFADQLQVNVVSVAWLVAYVAHRCWASVSGARRPHVINISSTAGHILYPSAGQSAYATTKAALNMLTLHLAEELAPFGVRVNAVAPNSFPSHVGIDHVSDVLWWLDNETDETGRIRVLDQGGDYWLDEDRVSGDS